MKVTGDVLVDVAKAGVLYFWFLCNFYLLFVAFVFLEKLIGPFDTSREEFEI